MAIDSLWRIRQRHLVLVDLNRKKTGVLGTDVDIGICSGVDAVNSIGQAHDIASTASVRWGSYTVAEMSGVVLLPTPQSRRCFPRVRSWNAVTCVARIMNCL